MAGILISSHPFHPSKKNSAKKKMRLIKYLIVSLASLLFFRKRLLSLLLSSQKKPVILYTSKLSPFGLKLACVLQTLKIDFEYSYDISSIGLFHLIELTILLARLGLIKLANGPSSLGELPLVPYLITPSGNVWYDSTRISSCLLQNGQLGTEKLVDLSQIPNGITNPIAILKFIAHFIEEFFDEIGLYMVHFERWTNRENHQTSSTPGEFLIFEELFNPKARPALSNLVPNSLKMKMARFFDDRQTKRLAYLFSIAPNHTPSQRKGFRNPPSSGEGNFADFPETWTFLSTYFEKLLSCLEAIFSKRNSLLGYWSIADASCFGQLNMNARQDIGTRRKIGRIAPNTLAWLDSIEKNTIQVTREVIEMDVLLSELNPLMDLIIRLFSPIMNQNEQAYQKEICKDTRIFNEPAFDKMQSLYTGTVCGYPYKSVIKTFQVEIWRELRTQWFQDLNDDDRKRLQHCFPGLKQAIEENKQI